jgi:ankyrin repeat protein
MKPTQQIPDPDVLDIARQAFQLARSGDAAELAAVLEAGLPVDVRNQNGDSLLMLASYNAHHDAARMLLARGADPNLTNDREQTPLAGAAFKGDAVMIRLLVDHGAEIDGRCADGKTALIFAAMFDRVEAFEELIAAGASAELHDAAGASALDIARAMGAERVLQKLKDKMPVRESK